jgi:hypothetical protein
LQLSPGAQSSVPWSSSHFLGIPRIIVPVAIPLRMNQPSLTSSANATSPEALATGVSSRGFNDFISRISPVESMYAIESGIFVFLIQKDAVSGFSKINNIPRSSGKKSRNISPFADVWGVSATSAKREEFAIFSWTTLRPKALESGFFGWQPVSPSIQHSARSAICASGHRIFASVFTQLCLLGGMRSAGNRFGTRSIWLATYMELRIAV